MCKIDKKKVAIITSVHSVDDTRIFWREAKSIAEKYFVTVYGIRGPEVNQKNLQTVVLPGPSNRIKRIATVPKQLIAKAIEDDPSIIHIHDPELIPKALHASYNKHIPIIFDNHENYPAVMSSKHWLPRPLRPLVMWIIKGVEYIAAKKFDAIITPTKALETKFSDIGANTLTIRNLPTFELFKENDSGILKKEFDVVHLGTVSIERMKTFIEIIKLVQQYRPNTTWYFIGLTEDVSEYLYSTIDKKWHTNLITRTWISPDIVHQELSKCRMGINFHFDFPQFRVAIPVKVLEYMATGIPVLSSYIYELQDELPFEDGNRTGVFYSDHNVKQFSKMLIDLLNHSNEDLCCYGQQAKQVYKEKLNWDIEKEKLLALYDKMLNK